MESRRAAEARVALLREPSAEVVEVDPVDLVDSQWLHVGEALSLRIGQEIVAPRMGQLAAPERLELALRRLGWGGADLANVERPPRRAIPGLLEDGPGVARFVEFEGVPQPREPLRRSPARVLALATPTGVVTEAVGESAEVDVRGEVVPLQLEYALKTASRAIVPAQMVPSDTRDPV
jgi:hypothetical protein